MSYDLKIFRFLFLYFFLFSSLFAKEFRVATYNVENLFDLEFSKKEYKEYIPFGKSGWDKKMFSRKIQNLSQVIKDIDADIIALQEVESLSALHELNKALKEKKYPYVYIQKSNSNIKNALLSRYEIKRVNEHHVKGFSRTISEVFLNIFGKELVVYLNHWPSYKYANESRIRYVKTLQNAYKDKKEYIILGDFNAPYEIQKEGWGESVSLLNKDKNNYNLWQDLPKNKRYSHVYGKSKKALDHIIVSRSMLDKKDIDYKKGQFFKFEKEYLLTGKKNPKRWQISQKGKGKHMGDGFSDHLALFAEFELVE